jgi:hypothetical protein
MSCVILAHSHKQREQEQGISMEAMETPHPKTYTLFARGLILFVN